MKESGIRRQTQKLRAVKSLVDGKVEFVKHVIKWSRIMRWKLRAQSSNKQELPPIHTKNSFVVL